MRAKIVDDYPVVAASDLAPYARSHQALNGSRGSERKRTAAVPPRFAAKTRWPFRGS